ncbi:MAG TPA: FkbM family methyltransferase [Gemmatales bacterium]|nr:FkbM family methyltransferase [Gemmatales bacterium]
MLQLLRRIPLIRQVGSWYIHTFLEGSVTPIRTGHARGLLWVRRRRYLHSMWLGDYETALQEALVKLLAPGQTFYDIGANAGFFSLLASRMVGPDDRVFSVDPDRANHAHMQELKKHNQLAHWALLQEAVDGQPGTMRFEYSFEGDSGGRLGQRQNFEGDDPSRLTNFYEVPTTTFDHLFERHGKPDVVKIDIEGSEFESFKTGAERLLTEYRPAMILELHGLDRARYVTERLQQQGYSISQLDGTPATFVQNAIYHVVAQP